MRTGAGHAILSLVCGEETVPSSAMAAGLLSFAITPGRIQMEGDSTEGPTTILLLWDNCSTFTQPGLKPE